MVGQLRQACKDGLRFFPVEVPRASGIIAAFTTRVGGVSRAPFDSLNLGLHTEDSSEAVYENRRLLSQTLSLEYRSLTLAEQIHGSRVSIVAEGDIGSGQIAKAVPGSDALVTNVLGAALLVLTADCVPLILVDEKNRIIASVHAGWRGTLDRIAAKTVQVMVESGADIGQLKAYIGPSIGPCCYEVGKDVFDRFAKEFGLLSTDGLRLDLAGINQNILLGSGLEAGNITKMALCTSCNPGLFYSWRRDGKTGRQGAVVALVEKGRSQK